MNLRRVKRALESALSSEGLKERRKSLSTTDRPREILESMLYAEICKPITEILIENPIFQSDKSLNLYTDTSGQSLSANELASVLCRLADLNNDPSVAIDWLKRVLAIKTASASRYTAYWGIRLTKPIHFNNSISILPMSQVPNSTMKDRIVQQRFDLGSGDIRPIYPPSAVVQIRYNDFTPFDNGKKGIFGKYNDVSKQQSLIMLLQILNGPANPYEYMSWFHYQNEDLQQLNATSGISMPIPELNLGIMPRTVSLNPRRAKELVKKFHLMNKEDSSRIILALERLNNAQIRTQLGDKALEVSIALESILTDGNVTENTYKIGFRAALLVARRISERAEIRALITSTYGLRSQMVHTGKIPDAFKVKGVGKMSSATIVESGILICSKALTRLIRLGKIPIWYDFETDTKNHFNKA
ncbi:hypothetical protein HQ531_12755 [bacterium]|nr:hypothetical protein [bacterium]